MLDPFGEEAATMNGDLFQVRLVALLPAHSLVFLLDTIKCQPASRPACWLQPGGSLNLVPRVWVTR